MAMAILNEWMQALGRWLAAKIRAPTRQSWLRPAFAATVLVILLGIAQPVLANPDHPVNATIAWVDWSAFTAALEFTGMVTLAVFGLVMATILLRRLLRPREVGSPLPRRFSTQRHYRLTLIAGLLAITSILPVPARYLWNQRMEWNQGTGRYRLINNEQQLANLLTRNPRLQGKGAERVLGGEAVAILERWVMAVDAFDHQNPARRKEAREAIQLLARFMARHRDFEASIYGVVRDALSRTVDVNRSGMPTIDVTNSAPLIAMLTDQDPDQRHDGLQQVKLLILSISDFGPTFTPRNLRVIEEICEELEKQEVLLIPRASNSAEPRSHGTTQSVRERPTDEQIPAQQITPLVVELSSEEAALQRLTSCSACQLVPGSSTNAQYREATRVVLQDAIVRVTPR